MGHSIGLSPDKKIMTFGVFKFNPEATESGKFTDETKIELTKKEAKGMIKNLRDWERAMVE